MFAESLARMQRRDRFEFEVDDATFAQLRSEFDDWYLELSRQYP